MFRGDDPSANDRLQETTFKDKRFCTYDILKLKDFINKRLNNSRNVERIRQFFVEIFTF